jgi:hypothetical protein
MTEDEYNILFHKEQLNLVAFKRLMDCDKEVLRLVNKAIEKEYERGFIDGMQKQMQSSVDKAVNAMTRPTYHIPSKDQREWIGLTNKERDRFVYIDAKDKARFRKYFDYIEATLKEKNGY